MTGGRLGRRFHLLWASTTATNVADGITLAAFPLLAASLTDDALLISLVTVGRFLPFVVAGLPLGVIVDRSDRRMIVAGSQVLRATVTTALAVAVAADLASIALIVGATFAIGLGEVLTDSAGPAMVRQVVARDQLELANARLATSQTAANFFVGPPAGAALFVLAPWAPFAVVVVAFALGMVLIAAVPGPFRAEQPTMRVRSASRSPSACATCGPTGYCVRWR